MQTTLRESAREQNHGKEKHKCRAIFFFLSGWTWIGPKKHAFILARGPNGDLGYGIWVILLRAACGEPVSSRAGEGGAWQRGTSHMLQGTLFDICNCYVSFYGERNTLLCI